MNNIIYKAFTTSVFFFLALTLLASGGQRVISGQVVNKDKGVPFAAVFVKDTNHGVSTDAGGFFSLTVEGNEFITLGIKGLGYKTTYHDVSLAAGAGSVYLPIDEDILMLEQVLVSGSRVGVLRYLPGSASIVSMKELQATLPVNGNEIFRNIPGLHVVEEEGAGLRTNIGIRGLDPDKSRNVLILEDGIPVALAPYGEPEMYFTPSMDRMSGVEVLKGNGSILFGPQTIGGVINYLTADPTAELTGRFDVRAGDKGFYDARFNVANTIDNFGFNVNFQRKQAENFGPTAFTFHDFNTKLQGRLSPVSLLSFKLGVYDETSNSTYIGLTQPMYNSGVMDDLRIAPDDNLHIRRYSASAIHKYSPVSGVEFNTTAFAYTTSRNWNRQDFTYNASASNITGPALGFADEKEGAIYLRNSTDQRNRQFEVAGVEPRIALQYDVAGKTNKTDAGVRYLYEKAYEQRVAGTVAGSLSGNTREDEVRSGQTFSAFIQNKLLLTDKLSLTAGLRSENIWYDREIMRLNFKDTLIMAGSKVFSLIPGAGANYNFNNSFGIFAGVHRGFAPPRTKDAISNTGEDLQLDAELSWNSEIGTRIKIRKMELEYTLFRMDFSNQVIPVSESSGGLGTGYINGGETLHQGMEFSMLLPFDQLLPGPWGAQMSFTGTYVNSVFSSDRFVMSKKATVTGFDHVYENVKGNTTPYAPELTFAASLTIENERGWGIRTWVNYTGSQYTDALNTTDVYQWINMDKSDTNYTYEQGTASGRIGKLDPFMVANASVWYEHKRSGLGFNAAVKNIFDERYISTRRPQGIRAGMPRFFSAGVSYRL
jgi:Fe(3+) dicitrate transport protein